MRAGERNQSIFKRPDRQTRQTDRLTDRLVETNTNTSGDEPKIYTTKHR